MTFLFLGSWLVALVVVCLCLIVDWKLVRRTTQTIACWKNGYRNMPKDCLPKGNTCLVLVTLVNTGLERDLDLFFVRQALWTPYYSTATTMSKTHRGRNKIHGCYRSARKAEAINCSPYIPSCHLIKQGVKFTQSETYLSKTHLHAARGDRPERTQSGGRQFVWVWRVLTRSTNCRENKLPNSYFRC